MHGRTDTFLDLFVSIDFQATPAIRPISTLYNG